MEAPSKGDFSRPNHQLGKTASRQHGDTLRLRINLPPRLQLQCLR